MRVSFPKHAPLPHSKVSKPAPWHIQSLTKDLSLICAHFEKQQNSWKPGHCSVSSLIQTWYTMFGEVNSSHLLADHLIPPTVWHPSTLLPVSLVAATWGNLARFKAECFAVTRGCFFSFLFFSFTNSLLRFSPTLLLSERAVLWCSWCTSLAQTTQACQQSAADSYNPSSQSSYPRPHYPKTLAVISCTAKVRWIRSERAQSIFIMFQANQSHTSRSDREALMHALFHQGLKVPPWEKMFLFLWNAWYAFISSFAVSMVKSASFLPGPLSLCLSFSL